MVRGHRVVHELGVGVEVFECRQFLLFGQLLTLLGITRHLHGEGQYLEIEVIGLASTDAISVFPTPSCYPRPI